MLLVVFLPLCAFLVVFLLSRFLNRVDVAIWNLGLMFISMGLALYFFYEGSVYLGPCYVVLGKWIAVDIVLIEWTFMFDSLTCSMLVVVLLVSVLVHIFSWDYMYSDPFFLRFVSYLSLFTFFMLLLVTAGNFLQLFLGWEGVGLASFLLINFWFTREAANKSALKAIIVNRIGDFCLYAAMLLIFVIFKTLDFNIIFASSYLFNNYKFNVMGFNIKALDLCCLFIFLAATGKSAQLGLHTWLPDAMEGPTPVSALIHAATMVTAGIFLIIRCSFLFEYAESILIIVTCIGALTVIFASSAGFFQFDLKKVIAFSTCSQLGYMVFACGNSQYLFALYHLCTHAFFKALLFLGAGSVIHAMSDEQDLRRMGGLWRFTPITYISFMIGSCSLMGVPYTTGFYSKDIIIETTSSVFTVSGLFSWWIGMLAISGTAYYSMRLFYLIFLQNSNLIVRPWTISEESSLILLVLCILSVLSLCVGFFMENIFFSLESDLWHYIVVRSNHTNTSEFEYLSFFWKIFPLILTSFGMAVAIIHIKLYDNINLNQSKILKLFGSKWSFDIIYNHWIVIFVINFAYDLFKYIEKGLFEPILKSYFIRQKVVNFVLVQDGFIFSYLFIFVFSLIFVFCFVYIKSFVIYVYIFNMLYAIVVSNLQDDGEVS